MGLKRILKKPFHYSKKASGLAMAIPWRAKDRCLGLLNRVLGIPSKVRNKCFGAFVKAHPRLLELVCTNAHLIRAFRKPCGISGNGKIKILHVTCSFDLGGSQRQILNLCENSSEGFQQTAIEIFPEHNYLYRTGVGLERERYLRGNFISRKFGQWVMSPSHRSLQVVQIFKLIRDFCAVRPDVVVSWGHEIAMLSFVAASIARVPKNVFCIRTFNPSHGWTAIGPLLKKAHKKMAPHLDGIIVNSTPLKEDYSKWLEIPREKISVSPNGICFKMLDEKERLLGRKNIRRLYNIPEDAIVICHIGRFSREKGQMLLVQAFNGLAGKYPGSKLFCMLCGDGATQPEIRDYVERNGIRNVVFAGRIDNVHAHLSASDIFVMPSDFEGMPNAMMEAMGAGLPCVSTDVTGALDVARDGIEALYINVGSVEQLAARLSCLIEKPEERKRIGENAKKRLEEFSITNMARVFERHIESFVKSR